MDFLEGPGPGSYDMQYGISPKGKQFNSKFESSRAARFSPRTSKRFDDKICIFFNINSFSAKRTSWMPGPGAYNPPSTINKYGNYILSGMPSSMCHTFGSGLGREAKKSNIKLLSGIILYLP